MKLENGNSSPFSITDSPFFGAETSFQPNGTRIDYPTTFTQDDWQHFIDNFCLQHPNVPEGFSDSAHLTYYAARGIEAVYPDSNDPMIPGIMLYYERYPGMSKNFFYSPDWSIYLNARWLAKRAQLPPFEERTFYTEKTDEIIFVGTPCAYAAKITMEEAQHSVDFKDGILTIDEGNGMQKRTAKLVEHDSQPGELRALKKVLERMQSMPDIFSNASLSSIENRIISAEQYRPRSDFFNLRFLLKR